MGGAWMNLVYGFGGLRTDGSLLSFKPSLPAAWNGFRFRIYVDDERSLEVRVDKQDARFTTSAGTVRLRVYGREIEVGPDGVGVPLEA
jgi:maltose phosphorylase